MIDPALAACAPFVSPVTLGSIIRVESAGRPLAININKGPRVPPARSPTEAAQVARAWIARGHSVDLGLMQVNNRNLARLGFTVEQMFDPCLNVRAGATILAENYSAAVKRRGHGQKALLDALSAYNTGSFSRGYSNGYISRYYNMPHDNVRFASAVSVAPSAGANPFTADIAVYSRKERENDATGPSSDPSAQSVGLD